MANFYLKKHDKENSITDSMQLSQGYYRSADEYYMASKFLTQDLNFMMVALTNIAFSCELYLKALLVGFFGTDYKKEKQIEDSHNIEELFKALPASEQEYIKNNVRLNDQAGFDKVLNENGNAFIAHRYACERKEMCGNTNFLFAFANILKSVYESLLKENNIHLA